MAINDLLASLSVKITGQTQDFEAALKRSREAMKSFAGDVNTDVRKSFLEFDKFNNTFQKGLGRLGALAQTTGRALTVGVTAPLVALGGASLKAFGTMDSLRKGLTAVAGSAQKAEAELAALQVVARNPGLGLEEAVKASIRLQSVGKSADEARKIIAELANANATVGGSRAEFDRLIYGFQQLANTDFPLGEDLNIVKDALPQVNKLLNDAFGTTRAEDLRKLGITSKQVTDTIVKGLSNLPRVSGGITNSFENLRDSVNNSLAKIGESINKNFDIEGKLNKASDAIAGLADSFAKLPPSTQATITGFAAFAAATGPVLFAIGSVVKAIPVLITGMNALKAASVSTFSTLRTLAVPLAIIAGAIALSSTEDPGNAQQQIQLSEAATKSFNDSIDKFEKTSTEKLRELKTKLSKEFRAAQFDALRPGGSDQEAAKLAAERVNGQLIAIDKVLTDRSIRLKEQGDQTKIPIIDPDAAAKAQKFADELDKIYRLLAAADEKGKIFADFDVAAEKIDILTKGISGFLEDGIKPTNTEVSKLIGLLSSLNNIQLQKLKIDFGSEDPGAFTPIQPLQAPTFNLEPLDRGKQIILDISEAFAKATDMAKAFGTENELAAEKQNILGNAIADIIENKFNGYEEVLEKLKLAFDEVSESANQVQISMGQALAGFATDAIANFTEALAIGGDALKGFGKNLLAAVGDLLIQLGKAAVAKGVAEQAILTFGSPAAAIAAGVAAIAVGGLLKGAAANTAGSPTAPRVAVQGGFSGGNTNTSAVRAQTVNTGTTAISGSKVETLNITGRLVIADEGGALVAYINKQSQKQNKTGG